MPMFPQGFLGERVWRTARFPLGGVFTQVF